MPSHYGRSITAALHQARREMDRGIGTTVHNWAQRARQAGIGAKVSALAKRPTALPTPTGAATNFGSTVKAMAQAPNRTGGIGKAVSAMAKARRQKPVTGGAPGIVAPDFPGNPRAPGGRRYRRRGPVDWTTKF